METQIKNLAKVIETKKQTFDYLKYTYLAGVSRKVDDNHVKMIMESMLTFGAEATTLIILETNAFGKKMRINADGNHRGTGAKLLNLPLDIKVVKLTDDTIANVKLFIAFLNNNLKKWNNQTYLEVFAEGGIYEYIKFKQILTETDLSITDLLHIYCGSGSTKNFQLGELKFKNEKDSDKLLAEVKRMREFIPNYSFTRRSIWKFTKPNFINGDYKKLSNAIIKFSKDSKNEFSADEKTFKKQVYEIWADSFCLKTNK
jgi:hypothetical protein